MRKKQKWGEFKTPQAEYLNSTTCNIVQAKNICKIYTLHFYPLKTLQHCERGITLY